MDTDGQSQGRPEWGYRLNFSPADGDIVHYFCGVNEIRGGICPNCDKPLLRLLSLDARDARLEFDSSRHPFVHLLYCWTCGIPFGRFTYRVTSAGGIELLQIPPKYQYEFGPGGPYDGFTGVFEHRLVSLQPLSPEQQDSQIARFFSDSDTDDEVGLGHQIGGYPKIYDPSKTTCPICSTEMPLLANICNDATGNNPDGVKGTDTFTDNAGVQMVFSFCRNCSVVSAYHSSD